VSARTSVGSEPAGLMVELPLLDPVVLHEIEAKVRRLRAHWDGRGSRGTFTLGRAAYVDAAHGADAERQYYELLPAGNVVLREHFGDLLEAVRSGIERHLGEAVEYSPELALPGFHIFEGPGLAVGDRGVAHFDLQHRYLRWPSEPDPERLISFTLPVVVPREGAGLDTWDVSHAQFRWEAQSGRGRSVESWQRSSELVRTRYRVGHLYIQPRMILHRIAGVPRVHEGDVRITMQGHGAFIGGRWVLYW
jgi:hypothetical protein